MSFLHRLDRSLIKQAKRVAMPAARLSLATVFIWFGALKILGTSPASELVASLQTQLLPFFSMQTFLVMFGVFEVIIGCSFVIHRLTRLSILLLVLHMCMTFLPLILLPHLVWEGFAMPTLEGQYIIKNFILLALALQIGIHLKPLRHK